MKKILSTFMVLITFGLMAHAQTGKQVQTVKIQAPTMQCDMCKNRIESMLSREEGVAKVNADYKRKVITVTFNTERTNIENIKTAIANSGYDADDVKANEEAYSKLPKCCKKPEDGGGAKKKN
jgi:copper chaperone CopZ